MRGAPPPPRRAASQPSPGASLRRPSHPSGIAPPQTMPCAASLQGTQAAPLVGRAVCRTITHLAWFVLPHINLLHIQCLGVGVPPHLHNLAHPARAGSGAQHSAARGSAGRGGLCLLRRSFAKRAGWRWADKPRGKRRGPQWQHALQCHKWRAHPSSVRKKDKKG